MRRRRWSIQEIQLLQDRYIKEGPAKLAEELGRSEDSVSSFAHRCGLRTARWLERQAANPASVGPVVPCCESGSTA